VEETGVPAENYQPVIKSPTNFKLTTRY